MPWRVRLNARLAGTLRPGKVRAAIANMRPDEPGTPARAEYLAGWWGECLRRAGAVSSAEALRRALVDEEDGITAPAERQFAARRAWSGRNGLVRSLSEWTRYEAGAPPAKEYSNSADALHGALAGKGHGIIGAGQARLAERVTSMGSRERRSA
jgi:hypothetical protein